jgi:hypothetical protein
VEYVPTLHFHQRHNKPMFWHTHLWLPWSHHPIAREDIAIPKVVFTRNKKIKGAAYSSFMVQRQ